MSQAELDLIRTYQPLTNPIEFETNPPLETLQQILPHSIIIASGSPRNGRFGPLFPHTQLFQQSLSPLQKALEQTPFPPYIQEIIGQILEYQEPRCSWQVNQNNEAHDSKLSLNKARITLAALLILKKGYPLFHILGRDFNVATQSLQFLDRPGHAVAWATDIPGWTTAFEDTQQRPAAKPTSPVDQAEHLYLKSDYFFTANSTTMLTVHSIPSQLTQFLTWIEQLIDLEQALPAATSYQTTYSFLCLKPDKKQIEICRPYDITEIMQYYISLPIDGGGSALYLIPGIIDWSRPPYLQCLQVWQSENNKLIHSSLSRLHQSLEAKQGTWLSHTAITKNPNVANELVGISTLSTRILTQSIE